MKTEIPWKTSFELTRRRDEKEFLSFPLNVRVTNEPSPDAARSFHIQAEN